MLVLLAGVVPMGAASAQDYGFRDYAQADGLRGLSAYSLYEDHEGVVWAGTELGLHRFDRDRFHRIGADSGLDAGYVRAITEDRQHRLWVGTSNGLFVRIGQRFVLVPKSGRRLSVEVGSSLSRYRDGVATVSQGHLETALPRDDGSWQVRDITPDLPPELRDHIRPTVAEIAGRLWFGCNKALCRLDRDGHISIIGSDQGLPADFWQNLLLASDGTLWVRGSHHIATRAPGATRFVVRPPPPGSTLEVISGVANLVEDRNGDILTRSDQGLLRWQGDHWQAVSDQQGIELPRSIGRLLVQHDGSLWIGTLGLGIKRWLGYQRIEHWHAPQGMASPPTWSIQRGGDGTLLVGNDGGGNWLDAATGRMHRWTLDNGTPILQATTMVTDADGAVWIGTSSGMIAQRSADGRSTRKLTQLPTAVRAMMFDRTGQLWLACRRGAYVWPAGAARPHRIEALPSASFTDVQQDAQGRLWMVSDQGLYLKIPHRWRRIAVRGDLPANGNFAYLAISRSGELWLSINDAGLWHGHFDTDGVLALKMVDDDLVSQVMPYLLDFDRQGRLWVGSSQGVDMRRRDGSWSRVTRAEGLLWDDMAAGSFFQDQDNTIWLGSSQGVSHITDIDGLFSSAPLHVEIASAMRNGRRVTPDQQLNWSPRPLEVTLATPGASGGRGRISFRYRLKGMQPQWTATDDDHISFPLLASGDYQLEVQALDSRARSESPIVSLPFTVSPPWWRSPAAIIIYLLGLAGAVVALLRWRTRRLLDRESQLQQLVAERTAELEREKRDLEAARTELAIRATRDALTGLLNRGGILDVLEQQIRLAHQHASPLAVLLIDLDYFKQINDRYGHLVGDAVLARVARRLGAHMRSADRIGRYGGEELLAVMPGLSSNDLSRVHALHEAICLTPFAIEDHVVEVTCSIGVAWYRNGESATSLVGRADTVLYEAKRGGRARVVEAGEEETGEEPA